MWALFILFATIANARTLEQLHLSDLFAFDKPIHMILFGVQAYLLMRVAKSFSWFKKYVLVACSISMLYGGITELMQALITTTRFFDYMDLLANTLGCIMVYAIWHKHDKD
jgi:glycopeptide antibiotics resistance protein